MLTFVEIEKTKDFLISKGITQAQIGIVLGTGLHRFIDRVDVITTIPYAEIPNFPVSTVEFHKGNLVYGKINNKFVLIMQGRFHAYEGYSFHDIVFPVRIMKMLGVQRLMLSNAAGGLNPDFKKGELVMIDDHINLQTGNPLMGKNIDELGPRFPDMSKPYSEKIANELDINAEKLNITLKRGVYVSVNGPLLETRAEYRYLRIIGADLVGMSTVPEVIAANHMDLPCIAISVVTDECDPDNLVPVDIAEIIKIAGMADEKLSNLFFETISAMD